ncbi:hypothetical protein M5362_20565 [Streptomyces sp. Je 1-79]|uniref:hypothetical protein n=1 Tax=Streptomyces sp. Je 1-79 TaxID=2943847 RepID=UPI0021A266EE|nr:hypothetical protein [Streptomyces sp. Je 1-79]MCT4355533.1 hypothetical protein [Streptomyces sp. Je 1-79]
MISEPELIGGEDFPAAQVLDRDSRESRDPRQSREPLEPRRPRPRRPWLWALGGAVVASAVWAGGLYAYERSRDEGVDLRGYRTVENLCERAELKALSVVLGKKSVDQETPTEKHPALDRAVCFATLGSPETGYSVQVVYELHKVTDPGPEFEPLLSVWASDAEPVEGLGEQAYVHRDEGDGGAWIRVLDGQAELEISFSDQQTWSPEKGQAVTETKKVDLSGIETVLVQDLTALMAALKK